MHPELDKALCERYPLIFAQRHAPMTATAMCWGFACEDGWYSLVDALCEELQRATSNGDGSQVVAKQVKQKYGGLRFYVDGASEDQIALINFAEVLSLRMCEVCGALGTLDERPNVWMTTRCFEHRNTRSNKTL